jgi:hypothetical protein
MSYSSFDSAAQPAAEALIADLFALGGIGYVALGSGPEVLMRAAPGLVTTTTERSNFFEELLVNPTLLKLAGQRGRLDCGGLDHIAVGYGDFTEVILSMADGHVSLGVGRKAAVRDVAKRAHEVLARHGRSVPKHAAALLA